jgi:FkbM family methyltransferase
MAKPSKDPFDLILRYLPDWAPKVIFDVGANIGQSADGYARRYPKATIHSFEPSPGSYQALVAAMAEYPNVVTHCLALGRTETRLNLAESGRSTMNHLLPADSPPPEGGVEVQVRPGADMLRELDVAHVDFLKIDTEGHDLEVLHGFLPVLDRVDFIQVEAGMNPYNTTHVPFGRLDGLLQEAGFYLFHILEQKMEWKRGGRPVLRRSNPVFINRRLVNLRGIR